MSPVFVFLLLVSTALSMPPTCSPGTILRNNRCSPCPKGTFFQENFGGNPATCEPCPAGTYNPIVGALGLDVCRECPPNTFSRKDGATSIDTCQPCREGTGSPSGAPRCLECRPGRFVTLCADPGDLGGGALFPFRGQCVFCGGGVDFFCNLSGGPRMRCVKCPEGEVSNSTTAFECTRCRDGTRANKDQTECTREQCAPGEFLNTFSGSCSKCFSSSISNDDRTDCMPCPLGMIGDKQIGATRCVPCPSGTSRSDVDMESCTPCPDGENTKVTGAIACTPDGTKCAPNFFLGNNGSCQTCTLRQRYDRRSNKCVPCPPNRLSEGGISTKCVRCPRGMIVSKDLFTRAVCQCKPGFGFVEESGRTKCMRCRPGTAGRGDGFCNVCGGNSIAPKAGMEECEFCDRDTEVASANKRRCDRPMCGKGLISAQGSTTCVVPQTNCPPKHERVGVVTQTQPECSALECGDGELLFNANNGGIAFCGLCLTGERYDAEEGNCVSCEANEFSEGGTSTACKPCPRNFIFINGKCRCSNGRRIVNGRCAKCPRGTMGFSETDGCVPCPVGTFSRTRGATECDRCQAGFFANEKGSAECKKCPSGTTTFGVGESGCVEAI